MSEHRSNHSQNDQNEELALAQDGRPEEEKGDLNLQYYGVRDSFGSLSTELVHIEAKNYDVCYRIGLGHLCNSDFFT